MQLAPYTPELYRPDSIGRYRSYGYPHVTITPIPGAGYPGRYLLWGEQRLNLSGSTRRQPWGRGPVPLLGFGDEMTTADALAVLGKARIDAVNVADTTAPTMIDAATTAVAQASTSSTSIVPKAVADQVDAVASRTWWSQRFLGTSYARRVAIPVLGGVAVLGLLIWRSRSKSPVTANRRRRRRR